MSPAENPAMRFLCLALQYEFDGDDEDAKNDIAEAEWNLAPVFFGE